MTSYQPAPPPPPAPNQPPSSHRLRTGLKWTGVIVISWAFGACTGALAAGTDTTSPSAEQTVTVTETPQQPGSTQRESPSVTAGGGDEGASLPIVDGDWSLDSIQVQREYGGDMAATARVSYHGTDRNATNLFTITVFKHGHVVASLTGSADGVKPGDAVTVDAFGTDAYVKGPYAFDFQNEL
jgi:hypothetical protein